MTPKRIFLTGASGCIGHYLSEALIQETDHELFLLVRNPDKIKFDYTARPGITLVQGDMREIEQFADLLQTIDCAILTATAWGDPQETYDVNVVKTIRLMNLLNPEVCKQVIYFSTASILGRDNQVLKEAGELGTDYVRSKYQCFHQLSKLAIAPHITTVFPTLVLGGDDEKPYSHLSSGIAEVMKWRSLLRFIKAEGSFHFIHGRDIAQVVRCLIDPPANVTLPSTNQLVLGNKPVTVDQAIADVSTYFNQRTYFRIPLSLGLANFLIVLFRIQMAAWDRFCLTYRDFTYQNPVSPATFGLPTYCATFTDILKISGIPSKTRDHR
ncbi:MAG: NAD(P)-dependent oxidoreductase [Leptolyngbyaceae bacterium]|nr:NAD(P)-dependent oxidoreductase [Leptolyngbyaceae bacterium]